MALSRRRFLQLATGAAAVPAMSGRALAETYPTRAVRIVVGSSAGDLTDIVGRVMAQWLSERLGQPFVIENRPGAEAISALRRSFALRQTATLF